MLDGDRQQTCQEPQETSEHPIEGPFSRTLRPVIGPILEVRFGSRAVGRGLPAYGWCEAKCAAISGPRSNRNPLDLVKRDLIASAIIELRRAGAFVCRHNLRVLEHSASFEIGRDPRSSESMAANSDPRAEIRSTTLNHAPGVDTIYRFVGQHVGAAGGGAEEGTLAVVTNAGGLDVGIEVGLKVVMRGHLVALAAFLHGRGSSSRSRRPRSCAPLSTGRLPPPSSRRRKCGGGASCSPRPKGHGLTIALNRKDGSASRWHQRKARRTLHKREVVRM